MLFIDYIKMIMNSKMLLPDDGSGGGSGDAGGDGQGDNNGDDSNSDGDGEDDKNKSNNDDSKRKNADNDQPKNKNLNDDNDSGKTFNQEDVNNIVARETKKAQEAFLKKLGVTDFNSAKEGLEKFREIQDSNKSEAEKQAERLKVIEKEHSSFMQENNNLKAQLSILKAGAKPEAVEDIAILANALVDDDTTIDDAVEKVLKKYPHFKNESNNDSKEKKKPKFSNGQHNNDDKKSETDIWKTAFNWGNQ